MKNILSLEVNIHRKRQNEQNLKHDFLLFYLRQMSTSYWHQLKTKILNANFRWQGYNLERICAI